MNGIPESTVKAIVLVHGGFVDGSGWEEVYKILKKAGYTVSVVQNPTLATPTAERSSQKPATIQRSLGLFISRPLLWTTASPCRRLSRIPRPALPYRRYCHRKTATYFSTRRSFPPRSRPTWMRRRPPSWLTLKFRGASKHSVVRSVRRHGGPSQVGIWSLPTTR